jgi:hypothetical protein
LILPKLADGKNSMSPLSYEFRVLISGLHDEQALFEALERGRIAGVVINT